MPSTERLEDQIHDAEREMKTIARDAGDLQDALDALLSAFAMKYPMADTHTLSEDFAARLADQVDDLQGPSYRRKVRLENEVDDIEWADLERSRPVTI